MSTIKQVIFLAREQSFDVVVYGLIPLTYHYLYRERNKVDATQIKPLGGKLGDPLITDANGKLQFTFFYDTGVDTTTENELAEANKKAALLAGVKEIVVSNINQTTLPATYTSDSLSFWTGRIEVQVKLPADNEYEDKTLPPPSSGGGNDSSFLGTGWFSTGSFFDW